MKLRPGDEGSKAMVLTGVERPTPTVAPCAAQAVSMSSDCTELSELWDISRKFFEPDPYLRFHLLLRVDRNRLDYQSISLWALRSDHQGHEDRGRAGPVGEVKYLE